VTPIRIMHIISGLGVGGAERSLLELLRVTDRDAFEAEVVSFIDVGPVGEEIDALGFPVSALGLSRAFPNPLGVVTLARAIRVFQPDVIQTWMYHADLLGGLAARAAADAPVAWGIRHTDLDPAGTSARTRKVMTACARLSRGTSARTRKVMTACARLSRSVPTRIVCNSHAALRVHAEIGYDATKMIVIPNGFDLERFRPDAEAGRSVRAELGVDEDAVLIGAVGRYHPQKDHATFVQAAALLARRHPEVRFVLCGLHVDPENADLAELIDEGGIGDRIHLLGRRDDVPRILTAFDVATSSSAYGEAFPRVATDVGDSAIIVGATGRIVPPRNPDALAATWSEMLSLTHERRKELGGAARGRIAENYEIHDIGERFARLYRELVGESSGEAESSDEGESSSEEEPPSEGEPPPEEEPPPGRE